MDLRAFVLFVGVAFSIEKAMDQQVHLNLWSLSARNSSLMEHTLQCFPIQLASLYPLTNANEN
eukprot:3628060-Amphidinium_carterae.1